MAMGAVIVDSEAPVIALTVHGRGNHSQGLEDVGAGEDSGELGEDSGIKDISWDGLLIENKDEEPMYGLEWCSDKS